MIYADCAAQQPPYSEAKAAAVYAMEHFGNPSGVHSCSYRAADMLFDARKSLAAAICAQPSEIIFTSSGTEADNFALHNAACIAENDTHRRRILIFAAEHKAVLNCASALVYEIRLIPSLPSGMVDLDALERMMCDEVCMVSVMHANNETGVIQPVAQAAQLAHKHGALFHTDAVQTVGHIPVDVKDIECDILSMSAHKFGGIPGAGALYLRDNLRLKPLLCGGGQEGGIRSGTEALPAIAAMGAAIKRAAAAVERRSAVEMLRDSLQMKIAALTQAVFPGSEVERVPGILSVCFPGKDGEALALQLGRLGVCASSGAACTTGNSESSHVLKAMGFGNLAGSALRFSLCEHNTANDVEGIVSALQKLL